MPTADPTRLPTRLAKAEATADRHPTPAMRAAGNYRHGRLWWNGLEILIEHPAGSTRTGTAADGRTWSRRMTASYGRIRRTKGEDGEPVDVFVGPHPDVQLVFVVDQLTPAGELDEHKCVIGCRNHAEARDLYLAHYPKGWAGTRLGQMRGFFVTQFKDWLKAGGYVKTAAAPPVSPAATVAALLEEAFSWPRSPAVRGRSSSTRP